jgi:putative addiction module killer protein
MFRMVEIVLSAAFAEWLTKLRDGVGRARIAARVDRMASGNLGDVRPVGEGVSELRIKHGPGYRVYFVQRGKELVILLCGGDKSSQRRDIKTAKAMARELKEQQL